MDEVIIIDSLHGISVSYSVPYGAPHIIFNGRIDS